MKKTLRNTIALLGAMMLCVSVWVSCDYKGSVGQLEIEEFEGERLTPKECGLDVLGFDYETILEDRSGTDFLNERKEQYLSEDYQEDRWDASFSRCFAILRVAEDTPERKNVALQIGIADNSYRHVIVSTQDDFALVTISSRGEMYVTGFTDGKFKNEAGLIEQKDVNLLSELSEKLNYTQLMNITRTEFFGTLYQMVESSKTVTMGTSSGNRLDKNGNLNPIDERTFAIREIIIQEILDPDRMLVLIKAKITPNYGIQNDYIDQLLAEEVIGGEEPKEEVTKKPRPGEHKTEDTGYLTEEAIPPSWEIVPEDQLHPERDTETEAEITLEETTEMVP